MSTGSAGEKTRRKKEDEDYYRGHDSRWKSALANAGYVLTGWNGARHVTELGSRHREKKRIGIEERRRSSGASGDGTDIRTDDEASSRAISYREFVRSFGPSPALTGHSSLRLTRHHSHHFSGLPLRSVPVPPLARKTESNRRPHHLRVGRGSYGTGQSHRRARPYGRVTWAGTWPPIRRPFRARASFRIERAHERDDAFCPTREKLP